MNNPLANFDYASIPSPFFSGERFAASWDQVVRLIQAVLEAAERSVTPPTVHIGTSSLSRAELLLDELLRYPGQVVVYGMSDSILPNSGRIRIRPLTPNSPLGREYFVLVYSNTWQVLFVATPTGGSNYLCALTQELDVIRAAAQVLNVFQDRSAYIANIRYELTAQLLRHIVPIFNDVTRIARGVGDLAMPLGVAWLLTHREVNRYTLMLQALGSIVRAEVVTLYSLDVVRQLVSPIASTHTKNDIPLSQDCLVTRSLLANQIISGTELGQQVSVFPILIGDRVWGAIEVGRNGDFNDVELDRLCLLTELIRLDLIESGAPTVAQLDTPAFEAQTTESIAEWRDLTEWEAAPAAEPDTLDVLAAQREYEAQIALERALRLEAEKHLAAVQSERLDAERRLTEEQGLRADLEGRLEAIQAARHTLAMRLAEANTLRGQLVDELAIERTMRVSVEERLMMERERRTEFDAATPFVGHESDGMMRDLSAFFQHLQEAMDRLKLPEISSNAAYNRLVDYIEGETGTVVKMMSELEPLTKPHAQARLTDLRALVEYVVNILRAQAQQREVEVSLSAAEVSVRANREALLYAVYNIVLSAIHMSVPRSTVTIHLGQSDVEAQIEIGFYSTVDYLRHLETATQFFDRGVPRRTGLALARGIIQHYRGRMTHEVVGNDGQAFIRLALDVTHPLANGLRNER